MGGLCKGNVRLKRWCNANAEYPERKEAGKACLRPMSVNICPVLVDDETAPHHTRNTENPALHAHMAQLLATTREVYGPRGNNTLETLM